MGPGKLLHFLLRFSILVFLVVLVSFSVSQRTPNTRATTASMTTQSSAALSSRFYKSTASCVNFTRKDRSRTSELTQPFTPTIELLHGIAFFLVVLLGSGLIAFLFRIVRKYAYHEKNTIETNNFDAGGTISGSLVAAAIVGNWTWAGTLINSSRLQVEKGISGGLWYAAGASIQIILFAMLAVQLRIRAPGAKTFLRVIFSRFGRRAHVVYVCFALLTNVIVTAMLMAGGCSVAMGLVKDAPVALTSVFIALIVTCYTTLGGMGAVFYVSYFCAALILIIIGYLAVKVLYTSSELNDLQSIYRSIQCLTGPEGNKNRSFNTIRSKSGLLFGIANIIGNFGAVFVDQGFWQIAVAAKPKSVVYGYLAGGVAWFAVPFGMSMASGMGYLALSALDGKPLLRPENLGDMVPAAVAQRILGLFGSFLVLAAVIFAVISTAAAEVSAVSSIIVHDIIQIYLKPYRAVDDINSCILCGRARGRMANPVDKCHCHSQTVCKDCSEDDKLRQESKAALKPNYLCPTHGDYRRYMDFLNQQKVWCLVICSFMLAPLAIFLSVVGIKTGWLYDFMGVAIGSAVIPICLCMFWTRLTSEGMVAGAIGGCVAAIATWLGMASAEPAGLSDFYGSTGTQIVMMTGNIVAIAGGGLICVVVSYLTKPQIDEHEIWDYTYDIDSPLYPWAETYQKELGLADGNQLDNRPTFQSVYAKFQPLAWTANGFAVTVSLLFVVIIPAAMLRAGVFSFSVFSNWVHMCVAWVFAATLFVVLAPLIEEAHSARTAYREFKKPEMLKAAEHHEDMDELMEHVKSK